MFLGHFALGYAVKRAAPRTSLGVLFGAAQCADLLWPFLVAAGIEQVRIVPGDTAFTPLEFVSYPYSHSLASLIVWGLLFAIVYTAATRDRGGAMWLLAALVVSHWVLDVVSHRPDLPLYPGGPVFGLGLWNSVPATLVVESAMFAVSLWMYAHATRARDRAGRWGFVGLAALLAVVYAGNVLGGPPPSVGAIWIAGILGFGLTVVLAWWSDAHRGTR
jgi:hypothetical protein